MIKFTLEGRDEGLYMLRLKDGPLRRLTEEQYLDVVAGGEIPMVDAPYPDPDPGPGLHPLADSRTGVAPQEPAVFPPVPQV